MRRFAVSLTKSTQTADDLVQDALERALRKAHLYQPTGSLIGWLCTITRNVFLDQRRRAKSSPLAMDDHADAPTLSHPAGQMHTVFLRETLQGLQALPAEQREVIRLVSVEGLDYRSAAERMRVPVGTVRSRLFRARERLAERRSIGPG